MKVQSANPKSQVGTSTLAALSKTKVITLRNGDVLEIAEPSALDQINLVDSLGPKAANQTLFGTYSVLLSVKKWNGEPVVTSNETWLKGLVQKFGSMSALNDGMTKIAQALAELTGTSVERKENESDDDYSRRVAEAQVNSFQGQGERSDNDGSNVAE